MLGSVVYYSFFFLRRFYYIFVVKYVLGATNK